VNESRSLFRANSREDPRRFRIKRERFFLVRLAPVDVGLRRCIDERIELQTAQRRPQLLRFSQVKLSVIEPNNVELARVLPRQGRTKTATCADDHHSLHAA
jgi:hypothetical protein